MIVSASDLTRTRLCRAENCPSDAQHASIFCDHHHARDATGHPVRLHGDPPDVIIPMLHCASCGEWKPDAEFCLNRRRYCAQHRRGRAYICRACDKQRLREHRARKRGAP